MFKNKLLVRSFSFFLLLEMGVNIFLPSVSWALTAGPTTPEVTSFEPVDTTDIVDLKTGDFVYNIPLLEVPGPAGGYPLSLSYHAGIQPNQEASWAGLGFTLNPGSIFRMVNGYPDDHNAVTNVDRTYWEGGETTTTSIGLSYGICEVGSVSAGLSFANDTYRGRGVGWYVGESIGLGFENSPVGIYGTIGMSPYGDPYASAGIGIGISTGGKEAMQIGSLGFGVSDGGDASLSGSLGVGQASLGASISTGGSKPVLSAGAGTSAIYNSRSGHVSIYSNSTTVDFPIWYGISLRLGRDYQRYWIDEKASAFTFGSLYLADVSASPSNAFDTYDLKDARVDITKVDDDEKMLGGSFPDVDLYTVMGQGISGNIRPYHYRQHLFRQDKKVDNDFVSRSYPLNTVPAKKAVEFRFVNDFSNRFEFDPQDFNVLADKITFDFDGTLKTGEDGSDGDGYNVVKNQLAGSKHVETYTNAEILMANPNVNPFAEGFIDAVAEGFQRQSNSQIGGYAITNASGVTYHYALPAYSFDEYMKSVNSSTKQEEDGLTFNEVSKPEKYAYTWFLTAVTGADFVDRNNNHIADRGDWGYWVNFEYEKWLSDYKWRNPGEGINRDLDGEFENFASGKKEIYYLSKVKTETHVAVFETEERIDGREVISTVEGGFEAPTCMSTCLTGCQASHCVNGVCAEPGYSTCLASCISNCPTNDEVLLYPRPTLRLEKIKLFNVDDFISGNIEDKFMLKGIDFDHGYSLAMGTPNSYAEETRTNKEGKLTLETLSFLGKSGTSLMPPMRFEYYKNPVYEKDKTDVWGFYKSDFNETYLLQTNNILGRKTTSTSAASADAWSLNKITTSLGAFIEIAYESDQYSKAELSDFQSLRIKQVIDHAPNKLKIVFWENVDLNTFFKVNETASLNLIAAYSTAEDDYTSRECGECDKLKNDTFPLFNFTNNTGTIDEINNDDQFLVVNAPDFYSFLKNETKSKQVVGDYCADVIGVTPKCDVTWSGANAWPKFFPTGSVSIPFRNSYGGGVRVKSIAVVNPDGGSRTTSYAYLDGTTSYEPYEISAPKIHPDFIDIAEHLDFDKSIVEAKVLFKKSILKQCASQLAIARELPGPGVIYGAVEVRENIQSPDGHVEPVPNFSRYEFQTYKKGMVDIVNTTPTASPVTGTFAGISFSQAILNKVTIKDYSANTGNLNAISLFSTSSNALIAQTSNRYLNDGLDGSFNANVNQYEERLKTRFNNQGLVDETFTRARLMRFNHNDDLPYSVMQPEPFNSYHWTLLGTISKRETYPAVPTGQYNKNFRTGVTNESETLGFDYYSGQPVKVFTKDSYGTGYLSETVAAYKHYPEMGSKALNIQNKNMLEQPAETYSYVLNDSRQPIGVLSASVQTWSNAVPVLNVSGGQTRVWRPLANYQWSGTEALDNNGAYPIGDFSVNPFLAWTTDNENTNWEKTGQATLYDTYSHVLEASDINSHYAATRMNKKQTKVIASAAPARFTEMAYSGAEYFSGNSDTESDIARGDGTPSPAHAHTGSYGLLVGPQKSGFNFTLNPLAKKYRASVWVYAPGEAETQSGLDNLELFYSINGQQVGVTHPTLQKNKSKSWYLLNIDIAPNPANAPVTIGVRNKSTRGVYFDDFRVHPINASMTSFVFDPFSGELTYVLDAKNFYTKFEYDAMGRLVRSSRELLNFDFGDGKESYRSDLILKEVKYNYAKQD